jgi:hypothetical protein
MYARQTFGHYLRRLLLSRIKMGRINCRGTKHTDASFFHTINGGPEQSTKGMLENRTR